MTSDDQIFAAVEQLDADLKSPARQSIHRSVAVAGSQAGGPVQPSVMAREEPAPGSAVAAGTAACESTGVVAGAGADVPGELLSPGSQEGRVGGAPGAATFRLPLAPVLRPFELAQEQRNREAARRLIGRPVRVGEGPLYDPLIGEKPKSP